MSATTTGEQKWAKVRRGLQIVICTPNQGQGRKGSHDVNVVWCGVVVVVHVQGRKVIQYITQRRPSLLRSDSYNSSNKEE